MQLIVSEGSNESIPQNGELKHLYDVKFTRSVLSELCRIRIGLCAQCVLPNEW